MKWVFFERKEPTSFGYLVGTNREGSTIPKNAKMIDFVFEGTEEEAIKQAELLEQQGYNLLKAPRKH